MLGLSPLRSAQWYGPAHSTASACSSDARPAYLGIQGQLFLLLLLQPMCLHPAVAIAGCTIPDAHSMNHPISLKPAHYVHTWSVRLTAVNVNHQQLPNFVAAAGWMTRGTMPLVAPSCSKAGWSCSLHKHLLLQQHT